MIQSHKIVAARMYGNVLLVAVLINGRKSKALNMDYDPKTHRWTFRRRAWSFTWDRRDLGAAVRRGAKSDIRRGELPKSLGLPRSAARSEAVSSASVFSRLAASSTFRDFCAGSICLSRPQSTLPGPSSMKACVPAAISVFMQSIQRTAPVTWRVRASRTSAAVVTRPPVTLAATGMRGIGQRQLAQHARHFFLRGLHQGAMEGRAYGKHDGAFCAAGLGQRGGLFDRGQCAGDDRLAGRVEICGRDGQAGLFGGLPADFVHLGGVEREDGGHGALTGGNGQLHGAAARLDGAHGVGKAEGSGGHVGAPLAEGVTGGQGRFNAMLGQHAPGGDARR